MIIVVYKDSMPIGEVFHDISTSRNIALQAVVPGHHQSSGGAGRRRGHYRMAIDHMMGSKKRISYGERAGGICRYDYDAP